MGTSNFNGPYDFKQNKRNKAKFGSLIGGTVGFFQCTCSPCSFPQLYGHLIVFSHVSTKFIYGPSTKFTTSSFFFPTKLLISALQFSPKGNFHRTKRTNTLLECTTFRVCGILFLNSLAVSLFSTSVIFFNHFSHLCIQFLRGVFPPPPCLFLLQLVAMVQNANEQDQFAGR